MNDKIEQKGHPNSPEANIRAQFKEGAENAKTLRKILELHEANQLCVPLYELREKPPNEPPDDTLSRLERLMGPQEKEYHKELVGGIYPLTEEGFLIILRDGTIIKIVAPDDIRLKSHALENFRYLYQQEEISSKELFEKIKKDPLTTLALLYGIIAYRTDDRLLKPEEIGKLVEEDLKKAAAFVIETSSRIANNRFASMRAIIASPLNPFSQNERTDE